MNNVVNHAVFMLKYYWRLENHYFTVRQYTNGYSDINLLVPKICTLAVLDGVRLYEKARVPAKCANIPHLLTSITMLK